MTATEFSILALQVVQLIGIGFLKPWAKGYSEEKSKNYARKEDLDIILAEVRAVTITQKEIEQKLVGDQWDRQTRWNKKQEIYGDLLTHITKMIRACSYLPPLYHLQLDEVLFAKKRLEYLTMYNEESEALTALTGLQLIYCNTESNLAQLAYAKRNTISVDQTVAWAQAEKLSLLQFHTSLIFAAKKDLELPFSEKEVKVYADALKKTITS